MENTRRAFLSRAAGTLAGTAAWSRLLKAAGVELEKAGDTPAALAAYRKAYDVLRPRFPVYAGVTQGLEMSHPRSLRLEPYECSGLRFVVHHLRRLDPAAKPLRGGLRFRIIGLDLPPDLRVALQIILVDAATSNAGRVLSALGDAPVQLDQTAWVGVADGRYRMEVHQSTAKGGRSSESWGGRASRLTDHLELDFSALPTEIEVRGTTLDLPPIRAFLKE